MCLEASPPREEHQSMLQLLEENFQQLKTAIEKKGVLEEQHQSTLKLLEGNSQQLKMIIKKQAELEQKINHVSRQ
jgi:hypothetical protein